MICLSLSNQQTLLPHPSCDVPAGWRVSVSFERERGALNIRYILPAANLRLPVLPNTDAPARADGLWQHTCAELFVTISDSCAYREFNFSPDGRWAAYDFVDYRVAAASLPQIVTPQISSGFTANDFCIDVVLEVSTLPDLAEAQFSATVVLEAEDGELSYWSVFHPCAKPDFHHRDGFVLTLV